MAYGHLSLESLAVHTKGWDSGCHFCSATLVSTCPQSEKAPGQPGHCATGMVACSVGVVGPASLSFLPVPPCALSQAAWGPVWSLGPGGASHAGAASQGSSPPCSVLKAK